MDDILTFSEWKRELHEEDIEEFDSIVKRRPSDYSLLYSMYVTANTKNIKDNKRINK